MAKVSLVKLSNLYGAYRWDAECYEPDVLRDARALAHYPTVKLGAIAYITDGQHGYHEVDEESPIRHITARCVGAGVVTDTKADRLSKKTNDANPRSQLKAGDVLLSTAGTIGEAGIVENDILPANIDQDVARIALNNNAPIDPYFLVAFLRSELGQFQCRRATTGQIQGHISLTALRDFDIPILKNQKTIVASMKQGVELLRTGAKSLALAEGKLVEALGLKEFDPSPSISYSRRFSHMMMANRYGAEYFMPCKQRALDALTDKTGNTLGAHYRSVRDLFEPSNARHGEQVRNYDLSDALDPVLGDHLAAMPAAEVGSTKKRFRTGDVVISRLRSYLREIALVRTSPTVPAVGSSEFIVLRKREDTKSGLTSETLFIYLRSLPVQTILKWSQDGSQHPRFTEDDLLTIPLPEAIERIAPRMDALVNEFLEARAEAARLLELAKNEVERLVLGDRK